MRPSCRPLTVLTVDLPQGVGACSSYSDPGSPNGTLWQPAWGTRQELAPRELRHPPCAIRCLAVSFEHPTTIDPDGRTVVFDISSRLHLEERRPWLLNHIDLILETVARPDHRVLDPIPRRAMTS